MRQRALWGVFYPWHALGGEDLDLAPFETRIM